MSTLDLFRKEALEYQKVKWTGRALLTSGVPPVFVATACLFFIIILLTSIVYGSYTRRINVFGEVITQPHTINLFAPQQGIISKQFVQTGEIVSAGTPLYEINVSRLTTTGNVSTKAIDVTKIQITQTEDILERLKDNKVATLKNLEEQLVQYHGSHAMSQKLLKESKSGLENMKSSMKSYTQYQQQGLINKDQENNQRYLFYQQQNVYQSLYNQAIQEQLNITNLKSEMVIKGTDFDNQITEYEFKLHDLKRQLVEVEANNLLVIDAPSDGRIESLSVTQGQMVNSNDSLAQLAPKSEGNYYLVLWIPNNSVPYLSVGDIVNIRYDAFPFQQFGQFSGKIETISSVPASFQEMSTYKNVPMTPDGKVIEPYYKVIAKLTHNQFDYNGKKLALSSGMRAETTVFLEKRPIYQWMLSPFYDLKKSLMEPITHG